MRWLALVLFLGGCQNPLLLREADESRRGRAALETGEADAALSAYDPIALGLPDAPDVSLGRGLASLLAGRFDEAVAAFEAALAEEPLESRLASTAEPLLRRAYRLRDALLREGADERAGRAYQNVGVVHLRRGDLEREQNRRDEARDAYQAAIDAFERSLVARPGDRDTAFNLELARLRLEEAELMPPPPEPDESEGDDGDRDEEDADQEPGGQDQPKDPSERGEGDDPEDSQDQAGEQDQKGEQDKDQSGEQDQSDSGEDEGESSTGDDEGETEEASAEPEPGDEDARTEGELEPIGPEERDEAERILRALEESDETLEGHLAKRRAARRRRIVEKDW
jgi:tetratricopeptide (TPR) repeat protein